MNKGPSGFRNVPSALIVDATLKQFLKILLEYKVKILITATLDFEFINKKAEQHSHGKSVGKYHMVIRVKRMENTSRMLPVLWPEKVFLKRFRSF